MSRQEVQIQRSYYAQTAEQYDSMQLSEKDEHFFALQFLISMLDFFEIQSVLDIGAGTGRAGSYIKAQRPHIKVKGVEPVQELVAVGRQKGLSEEELVVGDATSLEFDDGEFDLVCSFAVLHHIRHPEDAVAEMLRVARKGIFISDANRFGQGSLLERSVKQLLGYLGIWNLMDFVKTGGKGYHLSEGDGLFYSYSVFDNYQQVREQCQRVHVINTVDASINLFRTAPHVALLGIKAPQEGFQATFATADADSER